MATVRTTYPGNLAISEDVWTLTLAEGKALLAYAKMEEEGYGYRTWPEVLEKGTYWHRHLVQPIRRTQRAKGQTVTVYTAGFTTGEFSNRLADAGIIVS